MKCLCIGFERPFSNLLAFPILSLPTWLPHFRKKTPSTSACTCLSSHCSCGWLALHNSLCYNTPLPLRPSSRDASSAKPSLSLGANSSLLQTSVALAMIAVLMSVCPHKTELPEGSLTLLLIFLILVFPEKPSTVPDGESSVISKWNSTALGEKGRVIQGPSHHSIQITTFLHWAQGWPSDQTISCASKEVQHSISSV